jgi:hypothetical protein
MPRMFGVKTSRGSVFPAECVKICRRTFTVHEISLKSLISASGQLYKKKLTPEHMNEMLKFATQKPDERLRKLTAAVSGDVRLTTLTPYLELVEIYWGDISFLILQLLGYKAPYMRMANMEVDPEPIQIPGMASLTI